jgi:hypothetical protein
MTSNSTLISTLASFTSSKKVNNTHCPLAIQHLTDSISQGFLSLRQPPLLPLPSGSQMHMQTLKFVPESSKALTDPNPGGSIFSVEI